MDVVVVRLTDLFDRFRFGYADFFEHAPTIQS